MVMSQKDEREACSCSPPASLQVGRFLAAAKRRKAEGAVKRLTQQCRVGCTCPISNFGGKGSHKAAAELAGGGRLAPQWHLRIRTTTRHLHVAGLSSLLLNLLTSCQQLATVSQDFTVAGRPERPRALCTFDVYGPSLGDLVRADLQAEAVACERGHGWQRSAKQNPI